MWCCRSVVVLSCVVAVWLSVVVSVVFWCCGGCLVGCGRFWLSVGAVVVSAVVLCRAVVWWCGVLVLWLCGGVVVFGELQA